MILFDDIFQTAILHKGSRQAVEYDLPKPLSARKLTALPDAYYLSEMTRRIFRAGLKHSVIDAKWPAFEAALFNFQPKACAHISDKKYDELMSNKALIRHAGKMRAISTNAAMVVNKANHFGSFGAYIAAWPTDNIVGLWAELKKEGAQLGGMSAARFLRMVGKDTFLLTDDVLAVLKGQGVINKMPTSKKDLVMVQTVFNEWHQQTGLPLCQLSRIASMTAASWV